MMITVALTTFSFCILSTYADTGYLNVVGAVQCEGRPVDAEIKLYDKGKNRKILLKIHFLLKNNNFDLQI